MRNTFDREKLRCRARGGLTAFFATSAILSQPVTERSTRHFVQLVGAIAVEDQVVDQAEFDALEDDFSSNMSYGQDGDSGQVVFAGLEGTTAEVAFLDDLPTLVDGLDVIAVGFIGFRIDEEFATPETAWLAFEPGKGVRNLLPGRPGGCCASKVPDTFSAFWFPADGG